MEEDYKEAQNIRESNRERERERGRRQIEKMEQLCCWRLKRTEERFLSHTGATCFNYRCSFGSIIRAMAFYLRARCILRREGDILGRGWFRRGIRHWASRRRRVARTFTRTRAKIYPRARGCRFISARRTIYIWIELFRWSNETRKLVVF